MRTDREAARVIAGIGLRRSTRSRVLPTCSAPAATCEEISRSVHPGAVAHDGTRATLA